MIRRLKIRDFKSIREVDLELDHITILVGRSGTGKSNLVQAIRFLRNYLLNPDQAVNYEFGWQRIIPVGEGSPKTSIELDFTVPGEEREYHYRIAFGMLPGQPQPIIFAESLAIGETMLFARLRKPGAPTQWMWQVQPRVQPVPGPDAQRSCMLGSFPSLQQVVFAYAALSSGIGYHHLPASVLGVHAGPEQDFLKSIPGLSDNASNYKEIIRSITQDFRRADVRKGLLASLQQVNPSIESVELDSLTNPQKAIVGHNVGDRVFSLSLEQESDGLRRFYAHLLALYQSPPKLALVFEEPENAIFPGALSLLAEEFQAASREDRGQIILTTHSPMLLDSFDVENVRVVDMREGNTVVGRVAKEQRQAVKECLLTTGELLTVDTARIEGQDQQG